MTKPAPERSAKPIDWQALAAHAPSPDEEERVWEERRAIELERAALEDAIRRAIEQGTAEVKLPYRPRRTILANPYFPAICTGLLLLVLHYLASP